MSSWIHTFGPSYTPSEMLDLGIFEGVVTHEFEDIPSKYKSHVKVLGLSGPDHTVNQFKVKSLEEPGIGYDYTSAKWWEWYIRYYEGARGNDDEFYATLWASNVAQLSSMLAEKCELNDINSCAHIRQSLLEWGWDSEVPFSDDEIFTNYKRLYRLAGVTLATEAITVTPDMLDLGIQLGTWAIQKGISRASSKATKRPKKKPGCSKFGITYSRNPTAYLPYITVTEEKGKIHVMGFKTRDFMSTMADILNTTRFKNFFVKLESRAFIIEPFFVIELLRCIDILLEKNKGSVSTLLSLKEKLIETTWVGRLADAPAKDFQWDRLKRLNIKLLPKQLQFLQDYATFTPRLGLSGWLLAAAPGTGKTLSGIAWHLVQNFDTTIFIVPNNTKEDVWEKSLYRFFDKTPSYFLSANNFTFKGDEEFIICHYEYIPKLMEELHKLKGKRVGMWVDESHNFNELTSMRTNLLIDISQRYVEETVLASGTPLKALGKELVPLFRMVDKNLFTPSVEEKFLKVFGSTTGQVLELLEYRMDRSSFKVAKHEVVQNDVSERSIPVVLPDATRYLLTTVRKDVAAYIAERMAYYKGIDDEIVENYFKFIHRYTPTVKNSKAFNEYLSVARKMHVNFDQFTDGDNIKLCSAYERDNILPFLEATERKDFKRWAARYKYSMLVVRGEALGRILGRRRIECFKEMVKYANLEDVVENALKKTVIFTNYVEVLKEIGNHLTLMKHNPILVHGETNKELASNLKKFMMDPKAKVIVATYDSLSTGVPLVDASALVLFDSPFRNYIVEQTISRVDRLDQDSPVDIVRIVLDTGEEDNLSTRSIDLAEWSRESVDMILKLDKADSRVLAAESFEDYEEVVDDDYLEHEPVEVDVEKAIWLCEE